MEILSFDNTANNRIKRDPNQDNLFDLFQKNVVNNSKNMILEIYIVPREFEMRLDRVSDYIYGSSSYMEELMVLNDIINPYSIKEGQYIYFCQVNDLQKLYTIDNLQNLKETARQNLIKSNKNQNNINLYGTSDQNLPPTVKPSNLQQVKVTKDNKIQIINSFQ